MKINISRENLVKQLNTLGRVSGKNNTLPILANVLLDATDEGLRLGGTNLDIGLSTTLSASISESGALTVPTRLFGELIKSIPVDEISLSTENDTLHITGGNYQSNLKGLPADDFPLQSFGKVEDIARVSGDLLKIAIARVAVAAGQDVVSRPVLTGVHCELEGTTLKLSATDGYRLAQETMQLLSPANSTSFIVPAKSLLELGRILRKEDTVEIGMANNQLIFRMPGTVFYSATLSGNYPQVSSVIPERFETKVVLDTEEFKQAVRVSHIFAKVSANILRLVIGDDALTLEANSVELGDNTGRIDAMIDGERFTVGVNAVYLLDALNGINTPQTVVKLLSPSSPLVLLPAGDDSRFIALTMPMTLTNN